MSGISLHYTPVRRGFTQRGTVRSVTTVFTLYFETDQSEPLLGRLDTCAHAQFSSTTSHSLLFCVLFSVPRSGPPFLKMAAVIEGLTSLSLDTDQEKRLRATNSSTIICDDICTEIAKVIKIAYIWKACIDGITLGYRGVRTNVTDARYGACKAYMERKTSRKLFVPILIVIKVIQWIWEELYWRQCTCSNNLVINI